MRMRRKHLWLDSTIVRGRRLKEDGAGGQTGGSGGGQTPQGEPANTPNLLGNQGDSGTGDSQNNNTGTQFDPSTFWGSQGQEDGGSSNPGSASDQNPGSDTETLRNELSQRLDSLSFGEPVFSQEIAEQINEGNFEGFNTALNGAMNQAVRQALGLSVSVLRPFAEQLMTQVRDEISQTLGGRDDNDTLIRDFPAAKDKKIYPVVKNLYDQALRNTKGDRASAVQQVKEMMRLMSTSVADDLGLNVAPRGEDDIGRPANKSINWLDELSAR